MSIQRAVLLLCVAVIVASEAYAGPLQRLRQGRVFLRRGASCGPCEGSNCGTCESGSRCVSGLCQPCANGACEVSGGTSVGAVESGTAVPQPVQSGRPVAEVSRDSAPPVASTPGTVPGSSPDYPAPANGAVVNRAPSTPVATPPPPAAFSAIANPRPATPNLAQRKLAAQWASYAPTKNSVAAGATVADVADKVISLLDKPEELKTYLSSEFSQKLVKASEALAERVKKISDPAIRTAVASSGMLRLNREMHEHWDRVAEWLREHAQSTGKSVAAEVAGLIEAAAQHHTNGVEGREDQRGFLASVKKPMFDDKTMHCVPCGLGDYFSDHWIGQPVAYKREEAKVEETRREPAAQPAATPNPGIPTGMARMIAGVQGVENMPVGSVVYAVWVHSGYPNCPPCNAQKNFVKELQKKNPNIHLAVLDRAANPAWKASFSSPVRTHVFVRTAEGWSHKDLGTGVVNAQTMRQAAGL